MKASELSVAINVDVSSFKTAIEKVQSASVALEGLKGKCGDTVTALKNESAAHLQAASSAGEHAQALHQLGGIGSNAIGGLAEGMSKLAAGDKKINPLGDLAKLIGRQLMQMGTAWITAGLGMIAGMDPMGPLKLAEGTALVTAGGAMQAVKMASGGIVSGSAIVNVGEYAGAAHNPEVIAPLDKLKQHIGTSGAQHHTFRIKGDDLVSMLDRVNNNTQFSLGG